MAWGLNLISYGSADELYVNGHVTGNSPYLTLNGEQAKTVNLMK